MYAIYTDSDFKDMLIDSVISTELAYWLRSLRAEFPHACAQRVL